MSTVGSINATTYVFQRLRSLMIASSAANRIMYHAYLALISMTQLDMNSAAKDRLRSFMGLPLMVGSALICVICSSYHTPNHQTNANANNGDLVSEIVANTANGHTMKNSRITKRVFAPARSLDGRATTPASGWVKSRMFQQSCRSGWEKSNVPTPSLRHGRLKKRLAVAAQQNAANSHCSAASATMPASLESVKYRETAANAP